MKFKTSELTGQDLNEAVAIVVGPGWRRARLADGLLVVGIGEEMDDPVVGGTPFEPSTDWAHGGPIIERESIMICRDSRRNTDWFANVDGYMSHDYVCSEYSATGPTPLIAAMRAFVLSRHGEAVDL